MSLCGLALAAYTVLAAPNFTNLMPAGAPGVRRSCDGAMRGNELFIYGGFSGGTLTDLNVYSLNAWSPVADPFAARERHSMGYDPLNDRIVIVGGASGITVNDSVFLVEGATRATSTPALPATRPSARIDSILQWVPSLRQFIYFGGRTSVLSANHAADTWFLDVADGGVNWTSSAAVGPSARGATCSAWDGDHDLLLVFGGETGGTTTNETWQWAPDGGGWTNLTTLVTGAVPTSRAFCATEWDKNAHRMVLYGGQIGGNPAAGLYSFDPVTLVWAQPMVPGMTPGNLSDATAVWSAAQNGTLIFAGRAAATTYTNTTWLLKMNEPPVVDAGADFSVPEGSMVVLPGWVTDPDSLPTITWSQISGPPVTLSSTSVASPSFQAPAVLLDTPLVFNLQADDTYDVATDSVRVTVLNTINEPPTADAGPDLAVSAGALVTLSGSGVDPNGGAVTYSWSQTSGPVAVLVGPTLPNPQFTAPTLAAGVTLDFTLVVRDPLMLASAPDTVSVLVAPALPDAGSDAGVDAGIDAGVDAGFDAGMGMGMDAGLDAGLDAGVDAGFDAGTDAGSDAGSLADAGSDGGFPPDAGPGDMRSLGVGCSCDATGLWPLALLALTALRRRRPAAAAAERRAGPPAS